MNPRKISTLRPPVYIHDVTVLRASLDEVATLLPATARVWVGLYQRKPAVFARYTAPADSRDAVMSALGRKGLESMVVRRQFEETVR